MGEKRPLARVFCVMMFLTVLVACTPRQSTTPGSSGPEYWPTDGWRTSTAEEQGVDSQLLVNMLDFIQEQGHNIHSVTIVRHGYLIMDAARYPFQRGSKHNIHSCTKSITSALIGIAIEQGYIDSAEQPVLSLFPNRTAANLDADKEAMTLEDLLMMAAGLECEDSYLYNWRGLEQMLQTDDWIQFMLDLPMKEPPGTRFEYCNGASFLLSAIIQEMTGMNAAAFAEAQLFRPLGISDVVWPANPQGIAIGWGEMRMRPQDMAKIGFLYLNEGRWDGQQILPANWVADSTRKQVDATFTSGYGYQWWVAGDGIYLALGLAGQFIIVAPEQDLVVVFTSNLNSTESTLPLSLLYDFVIPAVKEPATTAPNPEGVQLLESRLRDIALAQVDPEPAPPLSQTAERITGKTYALDPNPGGLLSVTLTFEDERQAIYSWTAPIPLVQLYRSDPQAGNQVDWPVGLDNDYRFTPGPYGIPIALKGSWISEDTFVIHIDFTGNTLINEMRFIFEGDDIKVQITDKLPVPGYLSLKGRVEN